MDGGERSVSHQEQIDYRGGLYPDGMYKGSDKIIFKNMEITSKFRKKSTKLRGRSGLLFKDISNVRKVK